MSLKVRQKTTEEESFPCFPFLDQVSRQITKARFAWWDAKSSPVFFLWIWGIPRIFRNNSFDSAVCVNKQQQQKQTNKRMKINKNEKKNRIHFQEMLSGFNAVSTGGSFLLRNKIGPDL